MRILHQQQNKIADLEQQLAEKDKEIEKLNKYLALERAMTPRRADGKNQTINIIKDWIKQIHRGVCKEIKEELIKQMKLPNEEWIWESDNYAGLSLLKNILDNIEKGE